MEEKIYQILKKHRLPLKKREDVIIDLLALFSVVNWVAVTEKMPPRPDEDYLVCVRNRNKDGGIPIQDIKQFSSDGVFVGGSVDVWENVVYWAELPKPPYL